MQQQTVLDILSGRKRGAAASLFRAGLRALSLPYAGAMRCRRWAYRKGLKKSYAAGVPVICVGNITTGGTGKTPMVAWVVQKLGSQGRTPAILTRGYRAVDGKSDEAELLSQLTDARVVINPDRVAGARQAVDAGADVLVMDDGYQHCRLRRDLDIVLIDATNPFGFNACLPRGLMREPLSALRNARAIVITRSDVLNDSQLEVLRKDLRRYAPAALICLAVHKPVAWISPTGQRESAEYLNGRKVFAFCGLGNPQAFFSTVALQGAALVGQVGLDDHTPYDPSLADRIQQQARQAGAEILVTTQKDYVKISPQDWSMDLWQLAVEMDVVYGGDDLMKLVAGVASDKAEG